MTKRAELVFDGFVDLSEIEQGEVLTSIDKYQKSSTYEKQASQRMVINSRQAVMMGPVATKCPCCGR